MLSRRSLPLCCSGGPASALPLFAWPVAGGTSTTTTTTTDTGTGRWGSLRHAQARHQHLHALSHRRSLPVHPAFPRPARSCSSFPHTQLRHRHAAATHHRRLTRQGNAIQRSLSSSASAPADSADQDVSGSQPAPGSSSGGPAVAPSLEEGQANLDDRLTVLADEWQIDALLLLKESRPIQLDIACAEGTLLEYYKQIYLYRHEHRREFDPYYVEISDDLTPEEQASIAQGQEPTRLSVDTIKADVVVPPHQRRSVLNQPDVKLHHDQILQRLNTVSGYGIDKELKQFLARQASHGYLTLGSMAAGRPRLHQPQDDFSRRELVELLAQVEKYGSRVHSFQFYRRLGFEPDLIDDDEGDTDIDLEAEPIDPTTDEPMRDPYSGWILPRNEGYQDAGPVGGRQWGMLGRYEPLNTAQDRHTGRFDVRDRGLGRAGSWAKEVKQKPGQEYGPAKFQRLYAQRATSKLHQLRPTHYNNLYDVLTQLNRPPCIMYRILDRYEELVTAATPAEESDKFRSIINKLRSIRRYLQDSYHLKTKTDQRLKSRDALVAAIYLRQPMDTVGKEAIKRDAISQQHLDQLRNSILQDYGIDITREAYLGEQYSDYRDYLRSLASPYLSETECQAGVQLMLDTVKQWNPAEKGKPELSHTVFHRLHNLYNAAREQNVELESRRLIMQAFREGRDFVRHATVTDDEQQSQQAATKRKIDVAALEQKPRSEWSEQEVSAYLQSLDRAQMQASRAAEQARQDTLDEDDENEVNLDAEYGDESDEPAAQDTNERDLERSSSEGDQDVAVFPSHKDIDWYERETGRMRDIDQEDRLANARDLHYAPVDERHIFDHAYFHTDQKEWLALNRLAPHEYEYSNGPRLHNRRRGVDSEEVTDEVQELMYALHVYSPTKYYPRALARMFGMAHESAKAILLSRAVQKQMRDAGFPTTQDEVLDTLIPEDEEDFWDEPDIDAPEEWEQYADLWKQYGYKINSNQDESRKLDTELEREQVETPIRYDRLNEFMGPGKQQPLYQAGDEELIRLYELEQTRLRRFWNYSEVLDAKESEEFAESGSMGSPPRIKIPQQLDDRVLPATHHHMLLLDISDTPNARYSIAVRDRNGVLREPNQEEFKRVRMAERSKRSPFHYVKFKAEKQLR